MKPCILIVDDEQTIRFSLRTFFEEKGFVVEDAADGTSAVNVVTGKKKKAAHPDVVLLDVQLPDMNGLKVLEKIREHSPETSVIMMTGFGSVPQSVEAMRVGAEDYVLKPFNVDEIYLRVKKALESQKLKGQVDFLTDRVTGKWDVKYTLGPNQKMKALYDQLGKVAESPSTTVLILGETGTGKEVIANRIHSLSERRNKPFVAVNATALTAELMESELFGHEAGSFTGATGTKRGLFEVADGGTLFLDEIGDMDQLLQAKILRVLQERTIRRVGGTQNIPVDIRLLAATNKDLEASVRAGEFREDLYYRLNVIPVQIPPLRERPDDIETLVMHFVQEFNQEFRKQVKKIGPKAVKALQEYTWPGNIRELRNIVERTMLLECNGDKLELQHFKLGPHSFQKSFSEPEVAQEGVQPTWMSSVGDTVPLETLERQHIAGVLDGTNGNKNQAAQILGIDRTTLYNKLKKYQIPG